MSESGNLSMEESAPPEEIALSGEALVDGLGNQTSDAVDSITKGISAMDIPELETAAKPSVILTPGDETESSSGVKDESCPVDLNVGHRAQPASGEESEITSEFGAGESGGTVGAGRSGYDAGDHGTLQIVSASSPLGKGGEVPVLEEISSNELKSTSTLTFSASSSSDPGRMQMPCKEDNPGDVKQREDSPSGPSAGQKKASETSAVRRWKTAYAYAKNSKVIKQKASTSLIGTGATLEGYALGFMSIESATRKMLFTSLYNQKTEYILLGVILGHFFVLILKAEHKWVTPFHPSMDAVMVADVILTSVYTAECVGRILTLGLYQGPHAYLRNGFNKLDLIIVLDSWVHIVRTYIMNGDKWLRIAVLRIFRGLLVLRHFSFVGDIFAILDAIRRSVRALETVIMFTLMFLSFYALLGSQLFGGSFHFRCVRKSDNEVSIPERACINYYEGISDSQGEYIGWTDTCDKLPDAAMVCKDRSNPNWGATNFDNFSASILIVFQVLTFEGWSLIMRWANDSSALKSTQTYFVILVIFGSYFMVNVFVATISGVFLRVRKEHQALMRRYRRDKAFSFANALQMASLMKEVILSNDARLTWRHRLRRKTAGLSTNFSYALSRQSTRVKRTMSKAFDWKESSSYLKHISSFAVLGTEDSSDKLPDDPTLSRSLSRSLSRNVSRASRLGRTAAKSVSMTTHQYVQRFSAKCWAIVQSKAFKYAVLLLVSFNMIVLCSLKANMTSRHADAVHKLEIALIAVFAAELILRFLAAGLPGFVDEKMNVIDLLVVIISCWNTGTHRKFVNVTPIRMLRWFYVKRSKRMAKGGDNQTIMVSILRSLGALASVYFFLFIVIIMFSIFSMELWGGQMDEFDDGYPRANHDSFLQAMLLWFIVTTGESWVDYMWSAMRPGVKNRWVSPFIFIFYYMITAYVILNLIIATILEEMELTDNQKKHLQKREHLKWLQTKHFHGVSEKRSSDWLVGAVQGAQKGLKDVRRRMSSLKISRKSILPVSSSKTADVPQQQEVDDSFQTPSSPEGVSMSQEVSTKRSSYSALDTSVSSEEDVQSKARVRRRSSLSSLNPGIDKPLIRRSRSQEMDRSLLRSGDTAANLAATVNGGNRFVLQSAVLAIADDQALVAAADKKKVTISKQVENDEQSPATSKNPAYSRTRSVRGVSFLLSEFQEAPAVVEKVVPWWLSSRSLFLFQRDNVFRVFITKLIEHPVYLAWECLWIFLGVYALIRQSPMGPYLDNWINYSEYGHAAVFLVDLFFKLIAYGLIFTPEPYLGDPFNLIDFLNLLFSLIRLRMYWSDGGSRPTFDLAARCLMTVRPFRLIARFAGLRNLCLYIVKTIPAISQVFLFTLVVYAIYAVIGLQLYADRFRFCSDPDAESHLDCVGIFRNDVGIMAPRTWMNQDFNFDNFGNAMLSLFVVSTFDSWPSRFLYPAMDLGHKIGLQPRRNQSPSHAIYFVSFVCIGGFFILRMFVGVFIDQFGIISGRKLLTERQKLWRDTNRLIQGLRPKRVPIIFPTYGVRRLCFQAVYNRKFELLLVFVVMVNFLYLTTVQVGSNEKVPLLLTENRGGYQVIEVMFVCLYIVEAIMKLVGTQFRDWWDDKWNVMELCMAIISASCLYPGTNKKRYFTGAFFTIVRIFRVIRYLPTLNHMMSTVLISFPAMVNIMSLMGIFLCFFASMGNFVFWNIRNGVCIEKHTRDFRDFSGSFLILLQITTLDDWSCFLIDLRVTSPQCLHTDSNTTDDCGFPVGGLIYVLVCVIVTTYIFSNIFIAQILDTITFGLLRDEVLLSPDHVMAFQALWSKSDYDPRCTGYLGQHKLKDFFIELGPPLGGRGPQFLKRYTRIVFEVNHFRDGKGVAFRPLLETVCLYKIGPRGLELPVRIEREREIHSIYEEGAAVMIQGLVRGFLQRRRRGRDEEPPSSSSSDPPPLLLTQGAVAEPSRDDAPGPSSSEHGHGGAAVSFSSSSSSSSSACAAPAAATPVPLLLQSPTTTTTSTPEAQQIVPAEAEEP